MSVLLDLLYPPKCMLCGVILDNTFSHLCSSCLCADLPEYTGKDPVVPFFETCIVPWFYESPISDSIRKMKFHGMQSYISQYAAWMAILVRERLKGKFDFISWIPCSRQRVWSRGFDQAKLLAQALAEELNCDAVCTLRKIRHNPQQALRKDAAGRRANVLGVYAVISPQLVRDKRILLVDDVITTGATMAECGKMLQMAGCGSLYGAAIAAVRTEHIK